MPASARRGGTRLHFDFELLNRAGAEREWLSAAREASLGRERPAVDSPHVRLDGDVGRARVVDVEAACLALPVRARLAEPGCDRHGHAALATRKRHLELAALAHGSLVDVTRDDQLGAALDEEGKHVVPARNRLLARTPRRSQEVVVERHDAKDGSVPDGRELLRGPVELTLAQPA